MEYYVSHMAAVAGFTVCDSIGPISEHFLVGLINPNVAKAQIESLCSVDIIYWQYSMT